MDVAAGDVYNCADTASTGFQWKEGTYEPALFNPQKFKMRLDGSRVELNGISGWTDGTYECKRIWGFHKRQFLTCSRDAAIFNYNTKTGHYTRTYSQGWLEDDVSSARDSLDITYGTCEKFN